MTSANRLGASPSVCSRVVTAHQGLGVRWVRGEGIHRFRFGPPQAIQSGVSPVPRSTLRSAVTEDGQPPHSKTSRQFGRFTLERAVGTTKYAKDTKQQRFGASNVLTARVGIALFLCFSSAESAVRRLDDTFRPRIAFGCMQPLNRNA